MNVFLFAGFRDSSHLRQDTQEIHRHRITSIKFSPGGTRCVSVDEAGLVVFWRCNDPSRPWLPVAHHKTGTPLSFIVFRTGGPSAPAQKPLDGSVPTGPGPIAEAALSCFVGGGEKGQVFLADENACREKYKVGAPISLLEYFRFRDRVVIITANGLLILFTVDHHSDIRNESKMKLATGPNPELLRGCWVAAEAGLLATVCNESIVRFWNIAEDDNYILPLAGQVSDMAINDMAGDKAISIDFHERAKTLAVATKDGKIVLWRLSSTPDVDPSSRPSSPGKTNTPAALQAPDAPGESQWQRTHVVNTGRNMLAHVHFGPGSHMSGKSVAILAVAAQQEREMVENCLSGCVILRETKLASSLRPPLLALQLAPQDVVVQNIDQTRDIMVNAQFRVRGVAVCAPLVVVWGATDVAIFEVDSYGGGVFQSHQWDLSAGKSTKPTIESVTVSPQGDVDRLICVAHSGKVDLMTPPGVCKKSLTFSAEEGRPVLVDSNGTGSNSTLVVVTDNQTLKLWNVARSTPKALGVARRFESSPGELIGKIRSIRTNCNGSRVSILSDIVMNSGESFSDCRLHVYEVETDSFSSYDVGSGRVPVQHTWEARDPRLLACEVMDTGTGSHDGDQAQSSIPAGWRGNMLHTLFVTGGEKGLLVQDKLPCCIGPSPDIQNNNTEMHAHYSKARPLVPIGLSVPYIYFGLAENSQNQAHHIINPVTMRDFAGLESVDAKTSAALLEFSYHLACGSTDEAYLAVKGVQSQAVWASMAKMCVATGRVDVVSQCLGAMGDASVARALRMCEEPEPEARLALVAVHLNMHEDAERLYAKCGRYDLLNKLYQSRGEWEKAIEIAKTQDRIHLKSTYYAHAKFQEAYSNAAPNRPGAVNVAIQHYEASGTFRKECPRLLVANGGVNVAEEIESYIMKAGDPQLHKWYAQYLESKHRLDDAINEYHKAEDWLSMCRIACFHNDEQRAIQVCDESEDPAACCHLARHYEADGRARDAIRLYARAGCTKHALRLAQEHKLESDIMNLALSSGKATLQSQSARYYEQQGNPEALNKAVMLHQKAGNTERALELCFQGKLFDQLGKLSEDLSAESDPEILMKCADFFLKHDQHGRAVVLLAMSKQYRRAVELCAENNVAITDEVAESMSPPAKDTNIPPEERRELLCIIAQLAKKQARFQLACKKFTQAGDKVRAMKALLRSGDTEKIQFFASTARQPELYVLAANYLQSLDYHQDSNLMNLIVTFYTKAKAWENLMTFYEASAQSEIDEFRDYGKASGFLREAQKITGKLPDGDQKNRDLDRKIKLIDSFDRARQIITAVHATPSQPDHNALQEAEHICTGLLNTPGCSANIREGDIYATVVDIHFAVGDMPKAFRSIKEMMQKNILLTPYIDKHVHFQIFLRLL